MYYQIRTARSASWIFAPTRRASDVNDKGKLTIAANVADVRKLLK